MRSNTTVKVLGLIVVLATGFIFIFRQSFDYREVIGDTQDVPGRWNSYNGWEEAFKRAIGKENDRVHRLPDVIGIGVMKCGTGALSEFLSYHPYIRAYPGEARFFNKRYNRVKGLQYYRLYLTTFSESLPAALPHELIYEKTPGYFESTDLPGYLRMILPKSTKLILLLCDPVQRALSHYALRMKNNPEDIETFDDFVQRSLLRPKSVTNNILRRGIYHRNFKRWKDKFGKRLLVINAERLLSAPSIVFETVQRFLRIPELLTGENFVKNTTSGMYCVKVPALASGDITHCMDGRKGRTRSKTATYSMTNRTAALLRSYYLPYNRKLYEMIGQDFGW